MPVEQTMITGRGRRRIRVSVPGDNYALIVAEESKPRRHANKVKARRVAAPAENGGCVFGTHDPASTQAAGSGVVICKYLVQGDAGPGDSAHFGGGTDVVSATLVPIFYGSSWLSGSLSYRDVMSTIGKVLLSPYLSQLDQYGFRSLSMAQPIVQMAATPAVKHSSDDPGDLVWNLIDKDIFPEPDDPGGGNIYMVFYPKGTSVSDIPACAWHGQYEDYDFPFDLDWAWVGGVDYPIADTQELELDSIVRAFSHELVETITDPEADNGWLMSRQFQGQREISDACNASVDFLRGTVVDAYWSERHKACIIPKPAGYVEVQLRDRTLSSEVQARGTASVPRLICLQGDYPWTIALNAKEIVYTAIPTGFQNPNFIWELPDVQGGALTLQDGAATTVLLDVQTWYEDVNGVSASRQSLPVTVSTAGPVLTLISNSPGNLVRFLVNVRVSASEGAFAASSSVQHIIDGEVFSFNPEYYQALKACLDRIFQLTHQKLAGIPPIGPGDPPWVWADQVSPWLSPQQLIAVARIAAGSAAIQAFDPQTAEALRNEGALVCRVPRAAMAATLIVRGRPSDVDGPR